MANFATKITGQKEIQARIAKLRKVAPQFTKDAVNEFAINVQARTKKNITDAPAVDTGRYRASIKIETFAAGFAKRVGSDLGYGPSIEFGSGPHFPPLEPIREWARRHGLPEEAAYPIAKKIAERGTPAKPALFPAFESERGNFEGIIRDAWQQIKGELA